MSLRLPGGWRCATFVHTQLPWKAERGVFWQSDTRVILDLSNFQVDPCHRGCPDRLDGTSITPIAILLHLVGSFGLEALTMYGWVSNRLKVRVVI